MTAPLIRVTDSTSRAELEEALTNLAAHARRQVRVLDVAGLPSAWTKAHARIDALLVDWQAARGS